MGHEIYTARVSALTGKRTYPRRNKQWTNRIIGPFAGSGTVLIESRFAGVRILWS
ncbi:MAG: hypothetical protein IPJ39_18410 [Saprospiraceae bacterium]|nr:hypothetical protein [Saprospiraceae bacterium]